MKRLAIIFCSMLITINMIPVTTGCFVFADSPVINVPDGYSPAGLNDQVEAFKYYCKSRNLAIDGSVADAVTSFTTKTYQNLVQVLGLDINELQNEIYKNTGSGQSFFYTITGINAMNRIFAEFLQNNDLEVGDTVDNKDLYSGVYYTDQDGIGALVYVYGGNLTSNNNYMWASFVTEGNYYKYSTDDIISLVGTSSYTLIFNNGQYTIQQNYFKKNDVFRINNGTSFTSAYTVMAYQNVYNGSEYRGSPVIVTNTSKTIFYLAWVAHQYSNNNTILHIYNSLSNGSYSNANVYITTNNTTINNNNYEGDTIINNEGDIVNPTPQPTPIPDPNDNHSTTTDPDHPDTPNSDSNLTFPILDLDLPSIDWSIGDLSHKFPFSIPFDLYNMFSILNTEPQTPEISGEIDLGIYRWSVDWDLHQFDDTAELLRNVEFVGFIIGLIFITRSLIKG